MKPLKNQITITLDSDLLTAIRKLAEEDDRSISSTINIMLRKYMRENDLPIHNE